MVKYLILLAIVIFAWCPWLTPEDAVKIIEGRVIQMEKEIPNLCKVTIYPETIHRAPFGFTEQVMQDCTVTDSVFGVTKTFDVVLVTFYNGIIGMPAKTTVTTQDY